MNQWSQLPPIIQARSAIQNHYVKSTFLLSESHNVIQSYLPNLCKIGLVMRLSIIINQTVWLRKHGNRYGGGGKLKLYIIYCLLTKILLDFLFGFYLLN